MTEEERILSFLDEKLSDNGHIEMHNLINKLYGPEMRGNKTYDHVAGLINKNGKYKVEKGLLTGNLTIKHNPDYKPHQWRERHWLLFEMIKATITSVISILIGLLVFQLRCQSNLQSRKPQIQNSFLKENIQTGK